MIRNEYRRAFIMLRAAIQGYGGHVRLERRTLNGSMYFVVTAPEGAGALRAALAGQRDGQYYAAPLGALARDRRGQLTLAWQFDPRSIDGRPLESYAWVVVADTGGGCAVALIGNVEGAREVDPAALERAVCAAVLDAPAADLPAADAANPPPATFGNGAALAEIMAQSAESAAEPPIAGEAPDAATGSPNADAAPDAAAGNPNLNATPDIASESLNADAAPDIAVGNSNADLSPDATVSQRCSDASISDSPAQSDVKIYTSTRRRIFKQSHSKTADVRRSDAAAAPDPVATDGMAATADNTHATACQSPNDAQADITIPASPAQPPNGAQAGGAASPTIIWLPGGTTTDGAASASPAQPPNDTQTDGANSAIPTNDSASASADLDTVQSAFPGPDAAQSTSQTAAQRLGLDITRAWSSALEPLRRLFATQAPAEGAPDDDYIYIRAPMPPASGFSHCLIGLRAEDGRVTHIRYALPARYAPEPPAGLENYRWLGSGGDGHWVYDMRL